MMSPPSFGAVVHGGALVADSMAKFGELTPPDLAALRQYLRARAADLRAGRPKPACPSPLPDKH